MQLPQPTHKYHSSAIIPVNVANKSSYEDVMLQYFTDVYIIDPKCHASPRNIIKVGSAQNSKLEMLFIHIKVKMMARCF